MRIALLLTDISNDGGLQNAVKNLILKLNNQEVQFEIISVFNQSRTNKIITSLPDDIVINYLFKEAFHYNRGIFKISRKLRTVLKKVQPDILICCGMFHTVPVFFSHFNSMKKVIIWNHASYSSFKLLGMNWLGKLVALNFYKNIICVSKKDTELFRNDRMNIRNCSIEHIYNFSDITRSISYDSAQKNILSIGTIDKVKGFDRVITIGEYFFEKFPEWKWYILGDGPLLNYYRELVREKELEKNIFFEGYVMNPHDYRAHSSIFALTSRSEGFGLVTLEAKLSSLPVIAFSCNNITSEIIENNVNGFVIPDNNNKIFLERLIDLALNKKLREKFSKNTILDNEKFSDDVIIQKWNNILEIY